MKTPAAYVMKDIRLRLFAQEIEESDNTDRAYG